MTTIAARPRFLTILVVVLLVLQVANIGQGMSEAMGSRTRPPWVVAMNGGMMLSLLTAILLGGRFPRAAWALLALSIVCLLTSVVAVRQLAT